MDETSRSQTMNVRVFLYTSDVTLDSDVAWLEEDPTQCLKCPASDPSSHEGRKENRTLANDEIFHHLDLHFQKEECQIVPRISHIQETIRPICEDRKRKHRSTRVV